MVGFIWLETGRGHGACPKGGSYSDADGCGVRRVGSGHIAVCGLGCQVEELGQSGAENKD